MEQMKKAACAAFFKLKVSVKSEKVVVFAARTILIVRLKADTEPIHS